MTARQRLDHLLSQPAVGDLGYPADQRSVASVVLGLKLLADSIDEIEARLAAPDPADIASDPVDLTSVVQGLTEELEELTAQVRKLRKIMKALPKKK